jgi:hypothetical protein
MYIEQLAQAKDTAQISAVLDKINGSLPKIRADVARAEEQIVTCRTEVERLSRKTATMRQQMNLLHRQARDLKREAMAAAAGEDEARTKKCFTDYGGARVSYQRVRDCTAFLVSFTAPDADLAELEASLAERRAVADLHEALAAQKRAAALLAMGPAAEIDKNLSLDFQGTESQKLLDRSVAIKRDEIPAIEGRIRQHKQRIANERDAVSPNLFSVEF